MALNGQNRGSVRQVCDFANYYLARNSSLSVSGSKSIFQSCRCEQREFLLHNTRVIGRCDCHSNLFSIPEHSDRHVLFRSEKKGRVYNIRRRTDFHSANAQENIPLLKSGIYCGRTLGKALDDCG
jgi:hypothetical protein